MAKKTNTLAVVAPVVISPVSPVLAFVNAVMPCLLSQDATTKENAVQATSRSKLIVAEIALLFAAYAGDPVAYGSACVELFGDGLRTKDHVTGALFDALKAAAVSINVKNTASWARTVALHWSNADVRKAAEESGLRKARDTAKPKATAETKEPDVVPVSSITDADRIMEMLKRIGVGSVLAIVESALSAQADPIRASVVHDARVRIAA